MFKTIFLFEMKRWFKAPVFYIYCAVFFGLSLFLMMSSLGAFDGVSATTSSPTYINAPLNIAGMLNALATFVYFLLPTIVGASVYRDYQCRVHEVLFSYPLTKRSYLPAKFLSGLFITLLVTLMCVVGFIVGQYMPNVNPDLIGPNNIWAYLQAYFMLVVPNILLFGLLVFAVVNYSRNIYVGFIFVLVLFVLQSVLDALTNNMDNRYLAALLDPFGFEPITYYTKYWSIEEQNTLNLPFFGVVLYNRLIWLGVATAIAFGIYRSFTFSVHRRGLGLRKKGGTAVATRGLGSIVRIRLPQVSLNYGVFARLKTAWNLSLYDFRAIVRNWTFIVILLVAALMVLITASSIGQMMGTETYPVTWKLLATIGAVYGFFTTILIFLFAGVLMQRARMARMDLLIDATAVPNWVLFFSKFTALVLMVWLIQTVSMLTAIGYQAYHGYYRFELGLYITELFLLDLLKYLTLILFALFVHGFFTNYLLGFMVCILVFFGLPFLPKIGVEQYVFRFNSGPGLTYSDMNGYGDLRHYLYYRAYWILFGFFLAGMALLLWRRGVIEGWRKRLSTARTRLKPALIVPMTAALALFLALGYAIYYQTNVVETYYSAKDKELQRVDYEKNYKRYEGLAIPRLVDVKLRMDLYPEARNYEASIDFVYVNRTTDAIDTLFLASNEEVVSEKMSVGTRLLMHDTVMHVKIYQLDTPLLPSDTLRMSFRMANKPHSFLYDRSEILENGTFVNNFMFPSLSYNPGYELEDNDVRKKYGLPEKERMRDADEPGALQNNYISHDADWIDFEAVLSTAEDQIAISPGYLEEEWREDGRRYFRYKMDNKILNFYSIMSARYAVVRDQWNDIALEIYYHPAHEYNLERMMASMKKSLEYYENQFSPYQFHQMRIIEFPKVKGSFAQAFANTVPFSEAIGFIAKVDDDDPNGVDYPYSVVAHEFAHQWWAHQVIGANVKGATMLSESLAEYSSLKVLEKTYGVHQMRRFLKDALDNYLLGRANEKLGERPLMYNENQPYIHYNKGSLVMYAMSDFLGEGAFNAMLSEYIDQVAFQYPPYTTSSEFVEMLRQHTPDSLQYAIDDMFEHITLYDNRVVRTSSRPLADGKYEVEITFQVSKYRSDAKGKRTYVDATGRGLKEVVDGKEIESLPLSDYVDVVVFAEPLKEGIRDVDNPIYQQKHRIDSINNTIRLVVDEKPVEVGVDAFNKLIDTDSEDNRKKI